MNVLHLQFDSRLVIYIYIYISVCLGHENFLEVIKKLIIIIYKPNQPAHISVIKPMEEHDLPLDPYNYLGLVLNPNGSIQRLQTPVNYIQNDHSDLLIKDIPINESNKTWVRLILPKKPALTKLPLIVFFHGGGFVLFSVDSPLYNNIYAAVAPEIPAVIVSVGYRLAPEHRLPAAYDDCEEALKWIKNCPDEWLTKYADFSKVYLMGTSSGQSLRCYIN